MDEYFSKMNINNKIIKNRKAKNNNKESNSTKTDKSGICRR